MRRSTGSILKVLVVLALTLAASDLALRPVAGKLLYYRPEEKLIQRWPRMPLVSRFRSHAVYRGRTYGDLAAMSGDRSLREPRDLVFRTDALGFRNTEDPGASGAYDVLVLGDSFGIGTGTTQDRTWVSLLRSRYGLRTYNLSMIGSPWESYVNLAAEIRRLPLHPGSVVLLAVFTGNDLSDYYGPTTDLDALPWTGAAGRLGVRLRTFGRRSPLWQIAWRLRTRKERASRVLVRDFGARKMLFYRPYVAASRRPEAEIRRDPHLERLQDVIRRVDGIARDHDSRLVVLRLPAKEEVYDWVLRGTSPWPEETPPSGLATALDSFCRENAFAFVDLGPPLIHAARAAYRDSAGTLWWLDDTHWNEAGHAAVAEAVHRAVFESPAAPDERVPRPRAPLIERDRCPFECCRFGRWIAGAPLTVYSREGDTTRVAFRIAAGETLTALTGNVHVERLGEILVTRPVQGFSPGDTLWTFGYSGEGSVPVWFRGAVREVDAFWWIPPELTAPYDAPGDPDGEDGAPGRMVAAPIMDWWVRVRYSQAEGWLRLRNRTHHGFALKERIRGMDACG